MAKMSNVLMYIDDTNMFESAKWHSAKVRRYRGGVPDNNVTIDLKAMIRIALHHRNLIICRVYTTDEKQKGVVLGEKVKIKCCKRHEDSKQEKELDTGLTAVAVEDILTHKKTAGPDRVLILFSGDQDLYPVVKVARRHGYKIEHWAFLYSRSPKFERKQHKYPNEITLSLMDDIFPSIVSSNYKSSRLEGPISNTSIVASIKTPMKDSEWQMIEEIFFKQLVEYSRSIFKLPMVGRLLSERKNCKNFLLALTVGPQYYKCRKCFTRCTICDAKNDFSGQLRDEVKSLNAGFTLTVNDKTLLVYLYNFTDWKEQSERQQPSLASTSTFSSKTRFQLLYEE